jgi:hypothetical protein
MTICRLRPEVVGCVARALGLVWLGSNPAVASAAVERAHLRLPVAARPVDLEGGLEPGAWPGSLRMDRFVEVAPADNGPPPVRSVGYLIRDARALYVALHMQDPQPGRIRAPFVERDRVFGDQDLVQVEVDAVGDGQASRLFRVNPRGVQGDGVYSESAGADDWAPDFRYDSLARVTADGWVAVLRIPLASLAAASSDELHWRVVLYRNWPREFRHEMVSNPIPRGAGCWLCFATEVVGQPYRRGAELSATPYGTLARALPTPPGSSTEADAGLDLRWVPGVGLTVDATLWPDFSQVESDVPRLDVNARFALSNPEKRPFFMEGSELFATPIPAVYTRSISTPGWGLRATGPSLSVLVAGDRGGGRVVVPGPSSSRLVNQDFRSVVALGRYRRGLGTGLTTGVLVTGRVAEDAHNWVVGPDVDWRLGTSDHVMGQLLVSTTRTPRRPDLHPGWDGRRLDSHALSLAWIRSRPGLGWSVALEDVGDGFRADVGFVPQVGLRRWTGRLGYDFYPSGTLSRVQPFLEGVHGRDTSGATLESSMAAGVAFEGRWGLTGSLSYHVRDQTRLGGELLDARSFWIDLDLQPARRVPRLALSVALGDALDVVNTRVGRGGHLGLEASLRPMDRLGIDLLGEREWLDVTPATGAAAARLFTADVLRLETIWALGVQTSLRLIGQYERGRFDPALYRVEMEPRDDLLEWSVLFTHRLGWRTVGFVGYAESRAALAGAGAGPPRRQLFLKLAYELRR